MSVLKKVTLMVACNVRIISLLAQQPPVNLSTSSDWPHITGESMSLTGKYVTYYTEHNGTEAFHLQSTTSNLHKRIPRARNISLLDNDRFLVYQLPDDTLCIHDLFSNTVSMLPKVIEYQKSLKKPENWIAYKKAGDSSKMIIFNLVNKRSLIFNSTKNVYFGSNGQYLVVETLLNRPTDNKVKLLLCDLATGKSRTIWEGNSVHNLTFNTNNTAVAFCSANSPTQAGSYPALWYIDRDFQRATLLPCPQSKDLNFSFSINRRYPLKFSKNDSILYFKIERTLAGPEGMNSNDNKSKVKIWSYNDVKLPPGPETTFQVSKKWLMAINLTRPEELLPLENTDNFIERDTHSEIFENIVLTVTWPDEVEMNPVLKMPMLGVLSNTATGKRTDISGKLGAVDKFEFSPRGKYIVWYDKLHRTYHTYETNSDRVYNPTENIQTPLYDDNDDRPNLPQNYGIMGWTPDELSVFIYDQYDIWKVSPDNSFPPVNLTNGYGRKNKIMLRYINPVNDEHERYDADVNDTLLYLAAFDECSKRNGFFILDRKRNADPQLLTMSDHIYYFPNNQPSVSGRFPYDIHKAKGQKTYMLRRMSSNSYPNLMLTSDFRSFKQISNYAPHESFNWYTSELFRWESLDGLTLNGVLYKPQNFDSRKKYPVIFYYYEKYSDNLNAYLHPKLSDGGLDIPYFVSNGYLVFVPDIIYTIEHPAKSAFNSIFSAACVLSKLNWVDSSRMGLYGHSFGAYETNYIITQTPVFAAAVSAAGVWNFTSMYNSIRGTFGGSEAAQYLFERDQNRIGKTMWEDCNVYIRNSPIFYADKITTPLLIMHNKNDGAVPWQQSLEGFLALRRLNKPVWFLQYEGEGHDIRNLKSNQLDYSLRISQFFDHYLKNTAAPIWMTNRHNRDLTD